MRNIDFKIYETYLINSISGDLEIINGQFKNIEHFLTQSYNSVNLTNITLSENWQGQIIHFDYADVHIENLNITAMKYEDHKKGRQALIKFYSCSINIKNSLFKNGVGIYGGALQILQPKFTKKHVIENSRFENCESQLGGALFIVGGGITVKNSYFRDNIATIKGSDIMLMAFSYNLHFINIESSFFTNFVGQSIVIDCKDLTQIIDEFSITILDSEFSSNNVKYNYNPDRNSLDNYLVSGIEIDSCQQVYFGNSKFKQLNGTYGAAIYFTNNLTNNLAKLKIEKSRFTNLTAWSAGALYLQNIQIIKIDACIFENNFASWDDKFSVYNSKKFEELKMMKLGFQKRLDGFGGSIFYSCENHSNLKCNFDLSENIFNTTQAKYGGVIYYRSAGLTKNQSNQYFQYSAQYGPQIASYPVILSPPLNINQSGYFYDLNNQSLIIHAQSGVSLESDYQNLLFIYDNEGQLVNIDEFFYFSLIVNFQKAQTQSCQTMNQIFSDLRIKNGIVNFKGLTFTCKTNSSLEYKIQIYFNNSKSTYQQQHASNSNLTCIKKIIVKFGDCQLGSIIQNGQCIKCQKGMYAKQKNDQKCISCPSGVNCYGGFYANVSQGYSNLRKKLQNGSFVNSSQFFRCPIEESCIFNNSIYENSKCSQYYKGNLCNECNNGYARKTVLNQCTKCSLHFEAHIFHFVIIFIFLIAYIGITYKTYYNLTVNIKKNHFDESKLEQEIIQSSIVKLFFTYIQVLSLLYRQSIFTELYNNALDYKTPSQSTSSDSNQLQRNYQTQRNLTDLSYPQYFFFHASYQCVFNDLFEHYGIQTNYQKQTWLDTIIPSVCFFTMLLYLIIYYIKKKKQFYQEKYRRRMALLFLCFTFVSFQNIESSFFQYFGWIDLGDISNKYYVLGAYDMVYGNQKHIFYLIISGFFFMICIVIPLFWYFCRIYYNYHRNKTREYLLKRYAFLIVGYKDNFYYWEFVIWTRKIFIDLVINIFKDSPNGQQQQFELILTLIVYFLFYLLQNEYKPFKYKILNDLERKTLQFASFSVMISLLVKNGLLGGLYFAILVLILSILFFVWWVIKFYYPISGKQQVEKMVTVYNNLSSMISKKLSKSEDNIQEMNNIFNENLSQNDDLDDFNAEQNLQRIDTEALFSEKNVQVNQEYDIPRFETKKSRGRNIEMGIIIQKK